ncbi:MAG TPA: hypothetical protein VK689_23630, partial [Armatimonadota bacterium]|nr:hypothetical protein [Armatimonadota bacterium]
MLRELDRDRPLLRRRAAIVVSLLLGVLLFLLPPALWGVINYVPPFHPELPPLPDPNGYTVASGALRQESLAERLKDGERWQTLPLPELERALRKRRSALASVRAAFSLEWRVPDPLNNESSRGEEFREGSAWFAAESRLARGRGDYDAAMRHCLDAMELGAGACRGGDMGDRFVGQDCQVRGLAEAQRVVWQL